MAARARPAAVTVKFAWDGYREALGDKPAAVTMGHEWKAIGAFFGEMRADQITEEDCKRYTAGRRERGRRDYTIWTELGHLRSALKWAEAKNYITKAPVVWRPERPPPRDLRLTRPEVVKYLKHCTFPHIKLFVILAMTTGARKQAILDLTWDRVDFERGLINLKDPQTRRRMKGRALVPMNKTARAALAEAHHGRTSNFVIEWGGEKVGSVKKGIASVGKAAGFPWVTAHVFRHSAATHMAEDGVSMGEIAQFLGHSDSRITEKIYARFSPAYLAKAAASLEFDLTA